MTWTPFNKGNLMRLIRFLIRATRLRSIKPALFLDRVENRKRTKK